MPLYEYGCRKCGKRIEVLLGVHEEEPEHCPGCQGDLKRVLGVPGLIFKGHGFYATDYAHRSTVAGPEGTSSAPKNSSKEEEDVSKDAEACPNESDTEGQASSSR